MLEISGAVYRVRWIESLGRKATAKRLMWDKQSQATRSSSLCKDCSDWGPSENSIDET